MVCPCCLGGALLGRPLTLGSVGGGPLESLVLLSACSLSKRRPVECELPSSIGTQPRPGGQAQACGDNVALLSDFATVWLPQEASMAVGLRVWILDPDSR